MSDVDSDRDSDSDNEFTTVSTDPEEIAEKLSDWLGDNGTVFPDKPGDIFTNSLKWFRSPEIFELSLWVPAESTTDPEDFYVGTWIMRPQCDSEKRSLTKTVKSHLVDPWEHIPTPDYDTQAFVYEVRKFNQDYVEIHNYIQVDKIKEKYPNAIDLLTA
jgi:hypothetical protein